MKEKTGGRDKDLGAQGVISLPKSQQFKKSESPSRLNKTHRLAASPASKLQEFRGDTQLLGNQTPITRQWERFPVGNTFWSSITTPYEWRMVTKIGWGTILQLKVDCLKLLWEFEKKLRSPWRNLICLICLILGSLVSCSLYCPFVPWKVATVCSSCGTEQNFSCWACPVHGAPYAPRSQACSRSGPAWEPSCLGLGGSDNVQGLSSYWSPACILSERSTQRGPRVVIFMLHERNYSKMTRHFMSIVT